MCGASDTTVACRRSRWQSCWQRGSLRFTTDGQLCTDTPYCAVERLLRTTVFSSVEAYEFWGITWQTHNPFRFGWHSYIHSGIEPGKSS